METDGRIGIQVDPKGCAVTTEMIGFFAVTVKGTVCLGAEEALTRRRYPVGRDLSEMGSAVITDKGDRHNAETTNGLTPVNSINMPIVVFSDAREVEEVRRDRKRRAGVQNKRG